MDKLWLEPPSFQPPSPPPRLDPSLVCEARLSGPLLSQCSDEDRVKGAAHDKPWLQPPGKKENTPGFKSTQSILGQIQLHQASVRPMNHSSSQQLGDWSRENRWRDMCRHTNKHVLCSPPPHGEMAIKGLPVESTGWKSLVTSGWQMNDIGNKVRNKSRSKETSSPVVSSVYVQTRIKQQRRRKLA
ncbi:hypothetical protein DPEC_G00046090 [Dallia pectoralis]|uniref:Uncharacterized protein n=1 Tax=Dallia pectoralis TaxID=75939 RepID=A0ACC2HAF1_DALPE|nr:hypothetical protein DPEC_G00046090 [Dallia pectoralis]